MLQSLNRHKHALVHTHTSRITKPLNAAQQADRLLLLLQLQLQLRLQLRLQFEFPFAFCHAKRVDLTGRQRQSRQLKSMQRFFALRTGVNCMCCSAREIDRELKRDGESVANVAKLTAAETSVPHPFPP